MKLESQVCNLDLSKRLKELGVKQESYFYWDKTPMLLIGDRPQEFQCVSAFTVAELYKIHSEIDPHACYRFPEGIEPEKLADYIAEEIIRENKLVKVEEE